MAKINVSYEKFSRQSENSLSELLNLKRRYVVSADALYPRYRADCNRNRDLYTAEALEAQRKQAKEEYSRKRLELFNELWRDVGVEIDLMRDDLAAWVSEPGDPAFLAQIKAYRDFDLSLSRTELEALVAGAGGNYVCLRCLDTLARKSGLRVSVPSVENFGRDLETIKQDFWSLRLYGPVGEGDVLDLLPDVVTINGIQMGRPTVNNATIAWTSAHSIETHLAEIKSRWIANVRPMVTVKEEAYGIDEQDAQEEADRIRAENGEQRTTAESITVDDSGNAAVKVARELGRRQAEANQAADVVKRFY